MNVEVGDQVEYWRRDKGGPSQRITGEVLETMGETWCVIKRDDTGEIRQIDPKRLKTVRLGTRKPCLNAEECTPENFVAMCDNCKLYV